MLNKRVDLDNSLPNSGKGGSERFREGEKLNDNQARSGVGIGGGILNLRAKEKLNL